MYKKHKTDNLGFSKYDITEIFFVFPPKIRLQLIQNLLVYLPLWGITLFSEKYELIYTG